MDVAASVAFLGRLYDPESGTFGLAEVRPVRNLLTTAFGVLALETLGALDAPWFDRSTTAAYLLDLRAPDDRTYRLTRGDDEAPGAYLAEQLEDFAILALQALNAWDGAIAVCWDTVQTPAEVHSWLDGLDWSDPWRESNRFMFLANALVRRHGAARDDASALGAALDWLDARQNPLTGLWHFDAAVDRVNLVAAAYHFLFFYTWAGRSICAADALVQSTLATQHVDGLFTYHGGGGACEDLDAVDILARLRADVSPEAAPTVTAALERAHSALLGTQDVGGGFCWAVLPTGRWRDAARTVVGHARAHGSMDLLRCTGAVVKATLPAHFAPRLHQWAYSGLESMRIPKRAPDVWSTWFRSLAIATIEAELRPGDGRLKTRNAIGLGFFR